MLFPRLCCGCEAVLQQRENLLCLKCLTRLPMTNYHRLPENPIMRKFHGRLPLRAAFSFLQFRQGNLAQKILHKLKYEGREDLGELLGGLFASNLVRDKYPIPDVIIPLPLHPKKLRKRGFNQCHSILMGMCTYWSRPQHAHVVVRTIENPTQTRKTRSERWDNVENIFQVVARKEILGKHLLLVDDVITTGATMESCGRTLLEAGARELTFASIASA